MATLLVMKYLRLSLILAAFLFVVRCGGPRTASSVPKTGESWLATYLGDKKIGYSVSRYNKYPDGYRFDNLMQIEVVTAGKTQRIRSRSVVTTWPDLTLQSLKFKFVSQNRKLMVTGTVHGSELRLVPEGDKPRVVHLEGPVYPMAAIGQLVIGRKPAAGSTYRFTVFDATVMSVMPVEVAVQGYEKLTIDGKTYDALKLQTRMAKLEMTTWIDKNGMILAEKSPPKMRSERTSPKLAIATETGEAKFDLLKMFRIKVDTVIPNAASVRYVKVEISGIKPADFNFAGDNQVVLSKQPLVVKISVPDIPDTVMPLPVKTQKRFLRPTLSIQCDNSAIKTKAHGVLGEPKDAVKAAHELVSWVFTVLKKEPTASFPTALDVLKHMEGDCNEHAVFFAALARAVGIPTKVVVGLVYVNGAFYYHAWNEVFLDKWIPVDATFGEFPASALHMKLGEGELSEQAQILTVVGEIGIKIVEFKSD